MNLVFRLALLAALTTQVSANLDPDDAETIFIIVAAVAVVLLIATLVAILFMLFCPRKPKGGPMEGSRPYPQGGRRYREHGSVHRGAPRGYGPDIHRRSRPRPMAGPRPKPRGYAMHGRPPYRPMPRMMPQGGPQRMPYGGGPPMPYGGGPPRPYGGGPPGPYGGGPPGPYGGGGRFM